MQDEMDQPAFQHMHRQCRQRPAGGRAVTHGGIPRMDPVNGLMRPPDLV